MPPVISKLADDHCQVCSGKFHFGDPVLTDRDGDGALAVHKDCWSRDWEEQQQLQGRAWKARGSKGAPLTIIADIGKKP